MIKQQVADPRIAKKEMIVTRTKSAQQKRQLREIDRSMTKVTQLLKSPTNKTYKNTKRKPKTPEKKSGNVKSFSKNDQMQEENYKEYYPDKLRRKFEEKRIYLKPKYESQTVVKMNKRKLGTPQRGVVSQDTYSQTHSDGDWSSVDASKTDVFSTLSMEEIVRIVEETESLDDEDLMEILTCPSPVWWEDPPNENYTEDSLYREEPEKMKESPTNPMKLCNEKGKSLLKNNYKKSKKTFAKTDAKFVTKCNKLENVLGNIKNKVVVDHNIVKDKSEINKNNIAENSIGSSKVMDAERKEKNHSESTESFPDICFDDEEMLHDLENMDIPVCKSQTKLVDEIKEIDNELHNEIEIDKKVEVDASEIEKLNQDEFHPSKVPLNLPRLTKRPKIELEESPSIKSISDETELSSTSGQDYVDTISDTNIKFIIDDDIEVITDTDPTKEPYKDIKKEINSEDNVKGELNADVLKAISEKKEFITVYKIVSSESKEQPLGSKFKNIPEYSSYVEDLMKQERSTDETKCNGQLNTFFKKCKYVNRRKKEIGTKETDAKESFCDTCEPKKCITVAQDENVKYCLNCSSIFDTDECSYCLKSKNCLKDDADNQTVS